MTTRRHFRAARAGQAMVEFAMVLPLLLLLLVGLIEFGRAWNLHQVVTDASREGARNAVLPTVDEDSVKKVVKRALANAAVNPAAATIELDDTDVPGEPATVEVQLPYEFVFFGPLMGWATGERIITLTARSTMRNE
ncbi:MAG: pilus assembly protein [Gemmatimonadales bacterium]|nr:pilus assembly protein [Gemmatimonadales bacterium]